MMPAKEDAMRRAMFLMLGLVVAGCETPTEPTNPSVEPPALPTPAEFAAWPTATAEPVQVVPASWLLCRMPTAADKRRDVDEHGPHNELFIVVRATPDAMAAYRNRQAMPVGSTVVKEKHKDGTMVAYSVMRKRQAGFDAVGGDWEYGYFAADGKGSFARGRGDTCAACHARARESDFLFRSYLPKGRDK